MCVCVCVCVCVIIHNQEKNNGHLDAEFIPMISKPDKLTSCQNIPEQLKKMSKETSNKNNTKWLIIKCPDLNHFFINRGTSVRVWPCRFK